MSSDEYDQANQRCGEVIAKFRQSNESSERSSSPLVVVVCTYAAGLPIQLSVDTNTFLMTNLAYRLTAGTTPAYSESMPTQLTFCCCRRSPLAHTDARQTR
jgi:hypothetical protein